MTSISRSNPCRPNTRKWIVCDSALNRMSLDETKARLDELEIGAGHRIREYIADLWSDNRLRVEIVGGRMVVVG
jgi:hypothetical protein